MNYLVVSFFLLVGSSVAIAQDQQPNIVLIMADDIGFSDIGCYGSEIKTPNIDRLAEEGMRFQTFYNMAKCETTRSTMLTGLYHGGEGAMHIAQHTKQAGYFNIMSGKEHWQKWVPDHCRAENVFDHSFTFWATTEYFRPPSGEYERPFILEGRELKADEIEYQRAPMYKTDFITDYALRWLDEAFAKKDQPFFLYLPYHAAHYPLQARPEDIAKYRGKYKKGWDKLRSKRLKGSVKAGVLPKGTPLSPPEGNINKYRKPLDPKYTDYYPWSSLTKAQQDSLDLEMAVFAAIIDRMDQNIGRVLDKLEAAGKLDNTVIFFLVDNGSCPYQSNKVPDVQPGPANSYWCLRSCWANVGNTPFRYYKQFGHEGGCRTPFIVRWPGVVKAGAVTDQVGHIVDMAPTFLDILGLDYPETVNGVPTIPLHGKSLLPIFKGEQRQEPDFFISGLERFRMFRQGDWKIVRTNDGPWQLYQIREDPVELKNLAAQRPEKVETLAGDYQRIWESFLKRGGE